MALEGIDIREIKGIKYRVFKTPCTCECHRAGVQVIHIMACCNNGFKEQLIPI